MKILLPLILAFSALLFFSGCVSGNSSGSVTASTGDDTAVKIPASQISSQAKWFEYNSGGATIRFIAVKASDGTIRTAFDACDVCYAKKKGYRQEGNYLVCNNCGNRYAIDSIGTENRNPGGCWPSYLPSKVENGNLVLQKSDLEKGRGKFL